MANKKKTHERSPDRELPSPEQLEESMKKLGIWPLAKTIPGFRWFAITPAGEVYRVWGRMDYRGKLTAHGGDVFMTPHDGTTPDGAPVDIQCRLRGEVAELYRRTFGRELITET